MVEGIFVSWLDRERTVAAPDFNRWLIPPAALAIHLSIGQVYALSVFKTPLVERSGTSESAVAVIFIIAIAMLGLSAAFGGKWVERNGPRKAMFVAASCWALGFLVSAVAIAVGSLWLVYFGYGVIGGIGLGIGYISPVSTLIKWFPDRPGLSTGMAIMGFGGGALIASPLSNRLLEAYGASPADAIVPAFVTLGVAYFLFMMLGVLIVRIPPQGWIPPGYSPQRQQEQTARSRMQTTGNVTADEALKTPQFWLVWTVLFCNVTAGIGILEQASPMIRDFFPQLSAAAAAGFVGLLSIANMAGRFGWSSTSDYIGRKPTYIMFLGVGAVLFFLVATVGSTAVALFVVLNLVILTYYGGGFATVPAYLKDLFGTEQVGAIHGRLLTAWSAAGIAGPVIINVLTGSQRAAGLEGAAAYRLSLYVMVAVLVVGFVANLLVRPVAERHHMEETEGAAASSDRTTSDSATRTARGTPNE